MSIISLLSDKNPKNDLQVIQFLAKTGSPYAVELLRELAQRSKDEKMREYSKKAMLHIKKQIVSENEANKGKRKKLTNFDIHVEITMALALVLSDDFQQSKAAKRAVARAYTMDADLLNNEQYAQIAQGVFHESLHDIEVELRDFIKHDIRGIRALKSNYPFYMYLIDVPVVILLGAAILAIPNFDYVRRFFEWQLETNDFLLTFDPNILAGIGFVLAFLVAGRLFWLIIEQGRTKDVKGWEKEARTMAITHLENEIKKLSTAQ